jgi:hypothetical protein
VAVACSRGEHARRAACRDNTVRPSKHGEMDIIYLAVVTSVSGGCLNLTIEGLVIGRAV